MSRGPAPGRNPQGSTGTRQSKHHAQAPRREAVQSTEPGQDPEWKKEQACMQTAEGELDTRKGFVCLFVIKVKAQLDSTKRLLNAEQQRADGFV